MVAAPCAVRVSIGCAGEVVAGDREKLSALGALVLHRTEVWQAVALTLSVRVLPVDRLNDFPGTAAPLTKITKAAGLGGGDSGGNGGEDGEPVGGKTITGGTVPTSDDELFCGREILSDSEQADIVDASTIALSAVSADFGALNRVIA